ncbi:MAG: hypothetical protein WC881_00060 [Elusimicrobiota bacterium]
MEQSSALKQAESKLSLMSDRVSVLQSKLEDLLFRAQRIAKAIKSNLTVSDNMFGMDLQNFRRDVRAFSNEVAAVPIAFGTMERSATYDESAVSRAQAVWRMADRLHKSLAALSDQALLAHQHIRQAEYKVEAWYLAQEAEQMAMQTQGLPLIANKIVIAVSTPADFDPER